MRSQWIAILAFITIAVISWRLSSQSSPSLSPTDGAYGAHPDSTHREPSIANSEGGQDRRLGNENKPLEVRVVADHDGSALPMASWHGQSDSGRTVDQGSADLLGVVRLPSTLIGEIEFQAPGFVAAKHTYGELFSQMTVRLKRAQTIRGSLVDRDQASAPEGVPIFAIPRATWRMLAASRSGLSGVTDGIHQSLTHSDGSFQLDGLALGEAYVVVACGSGVASLPEFVSGEQAESTIQLHGGHLATAQVLLIDAMTGTPIRTSSRLAGIRSGIAISFPKRGGLSHANLPDPVLRGIGVDPSLQNSGESWHLRALAQFRSHADLFARTTVRMPGYTPESVEVRYWPHGTPTHPHEIRLDPVASSWGSALVNVDWGTEELGTGEKAVATLRFVPVGQDSTQLGTFEMELDSTKRTTLLESIPTADYVVHLRLRRGMMEIPPANNPDSHVSIGDQERAQVQFDLSDLGSATFLLSDAELTEYQASFRGTIIAEINQQSTEFDFYFPGPPYRFLGLPPGTYRFLLDPPTLSPMPVDLESAGAPFEVRAGEPGIVHDLQIRF